LLSCVAVAAGVVLDAEGAEASLREMLAAALEANRQLSELAERQQVQLTELRELNARLVARDAEREAELEETRAALAVLQRMLFGRKSEKNRPEPAGGGDGDGAPAGDGPAGGGNKDVRRGPGARAGRRDYSRLPRVEVTWDFDGGYCCPQCGVPFTGLGSDHVTELLDWRVIVRLAAHCRRRYKRACSCPGPATVTAPGPPKAIGKGLFTNGFAAMLLVERFAAGRSMNSLVTGLARQGAEISPATLAGTCAQAGALLAPLAAVIAERNRDSWHLHADETTWRVFCPGDGAGPAKWWLWVFTAPRGAVSYRSRSGQGWEEVSPDLMAYSGPKG